MPTARQAPTAFGWRGVARRERGRGWPWVAVGGRGCPWVGAAMAVAVAVRVCTAHGMRVAHTGGYVGESVCGVGAVFGGVGVRC